MLFAIMAISVGAALGALARWGLTLWLGIGVMPWGTLAANLIGGYLVGVVVALLALAPDISPLWRLALVTGFLGGLTTFSSFSAEVVIFLMDARYGLAALTATVHVLGSLLMTMLGLKSAMFLIAANAR